MPVIYQMQVRGVNPARWAAAQPEVVHLRRAYDGSAPAGAFEVSLIARAAILAAVAALSRLLPAP